jgi:UDP-2-acetamido-3-amino-2,3-dideoxy-glucuronate N-acetyltransferase
MNQIHHPRNLALIGAGYWGKHLARNFLALNVLHTLCDQNGDTLEQYGATYEAVAKSKDIRSVLADPSIACVAIATPAATHHDLVRDALLADKDVFVEKPLCLDVTQGRQLVELAESRGRILMVGHLLQYHPYVLKLQALLAQGELGKLHYITSNRLNLGKIRREENALWSFAPHDVSVILSLAGHQLPDKVSCMGEAYLNQGVADITFTSLRFPGGVRAHAYVNWLNPFKEQKLTVVGSHGMVVFDDTRPWNEKLVIYRHYLTWTNGQVPTPNKSSGEAIVVPEAEPLREECLHFLTCCADRRSPRTDGREGLRVLQVLQSAQESLELDGEAILPREAVSSAPAPASRSRAVLPEAPSGACRYFVHPTAVVDEGAVIGQGTKVWHFSHVMKEARIGQRCVLGQNVNVDGGAVIGDNVKIQNNVSVYSGVTIEDDVFLGPSCVLTNVTNPRSQVNRHRLYEKTVLRRGCTIGANATILCGVTIGRYAFIAAGAVVTRDVHDYALVQGNPARPQGWMSRHGHRLSEPDANGIMCCPESGLRYQLHSGTRAPILRCLDLDEDSPLPELMAVGKHAYEQLKRAEDRLPK